MSLLSDFLGKHVEGYLFEDIKSLMAVPVPNGDGPGGVGYPLVMTVLAGVELLGSVYEALGSQSVFNRKAGNDYFKKYWQDLLYPQWPGIGEPLYQLARHGLMHAFTTKGPLVVSKNPHGRPYHLTKSSAGEVHINCDQLADDFRKSYDNGFKPAVLRDSARGEERIRDMGKTYVDQATDWLTGVRFPSPPSPPPAVPVSASAAAFVPVLTTSAPMWPPTAVTSSIIK